MLARLAIAVLVLLGLIGAVFLAAAFGAFAGGAGLTAILLLLAAGNRMLNWTQGHPDDLKFGNAALAAGRKHDRRRQARREAAAHREATEEGGADE